jgi:hypothetical protein
MREWNEWFVLNVLSLSMLPLSHVFSFSFSLLSWDFLTTSSYQRMWMTHVSFSTRTPPVHIVFIFRLLKMVGCSFDHRITFTSSS